MTEFSVYAPSGYGTMKELVRGCLFEVLENYMQNKNEGNENKIILGGLNVLWKK